MGGRRRGWDQIRRMHVDPHQKQKGIFEEANAVHCAMHKLGLCWNSRGSRVGVRKYNLHEEEISSMELDCGLDVPCVVQWRLLWFTAHPRLNKIWGQDLKIKKNHEVVDIAVKEAISRPFGGKHTSTSCMLTLPPVRTHRS